MLDAEHLLPPYFKKARRLSRILTFHNVRQGGIVNNGINSIYLFYLLQKYTVGTLPVLPRKNFEGLYFKFFLLHAYIYCQHAHMIWHSINALLLNLFKVHNYLGLLYD